MMALVMFTAAFSIEGLALPAPAQAATMVVNQCNDHGPGAKGATTTMRCTVAVVNTISGTTTSSATTVTRLCLLGPCSTPNGTFTTHSTSLVTAIRQCNNSDNDTAHAISCNVNITDIIMANTPGVRPLSAATVSQCVGSGTGGGGTVTCQPRSATTTAATVTQCNGSGNGGGGTVQCSVDPSSAGSRAIPITVNQCNGTANVGGSKVTCTARLVTTITNTPTAARAAVAVATAAATATATPTTTPTATSPPVTMAASGAVKTGAEPSSGTPYGLLLMIGAAVVLVAAISALLYRRFAHTR